MLEQPQAVVKVLREILANPYSLPSA